MDIWLGLVVLTLAVGGTLASPIQNSRNCAKRQCTATSKFIYHPGQTYEYRYDGSVATKVNGASEGSSGMQMSAIAHIEVITSCEYALKLSDVAITELDSEGRPRRLFGTESFRQSLEADSLRFSFQDGRIEEVCPMPREKSWITNIKRGILSSFQNSMENLRTPTNKREVDITGNCPADYRIAERGYTSVTVDRHKDLLACTDRHGYKTAFQATPYRVSSNIQSLPLTKSSHNCRQTFHNSGYMTQVECTEHHVFRPFSKDNNGASTQALHKLVYQSQRPGVSTNLRENFRRTSLLFEHDETAITSNNDAAARELLTQTCQQSANEVRPETPKLFSELVYRMKQLDTPTLRGLHRAVREGQVCAINIAASKKTFMDAVPMTGTVASVSLMGELIRSREVQGKEADMWLTSLAFIQEPKLEMIKTVKDLLTHGAQNQRNYLSTSALIHNYCRHNGQCQNELAIQEVLQLLESKLNNNCRVRQSVDEERMIMILKALANTGVAPGASQTLGQCALEPSNSMEIRLAALDTLRNQPCEARREVALRLFSDPEQVDEIRIAAYLASMKCATTDIIRQVQRVLESEKANQVGSFVWTHLTNLMESDDPHKAEIKAILDDVFLQKEFNMDRRKFSRNYDASVFLDSINTGAKVESNVIWSRKSFVPRSAMMNLTVDLFGQSVNLLEVGGRVEGMEQLLETFFGPNGYFPEKTVMDTLRRDKRQVANHKLARVDRTYDAKSKQDNIRGSMYFKVFGNEMGYFDLLNLRSASDFNILDILIKLSQNQHMELNKSIMFLDTSITIPTIVGLPLKLSVNGTASINIGLSGKLDMRRAHPAPRTVDIDGKVKSSVAVQIASMMSIDANVARTGLKMISTLHSSTEVDGKFQVQNSQIMVLQLNMPREKQELIAIDNKFYTLYQREEKEQLMTDNEGVEERRCTGDKLVKILGVELCGEVRYPLARNVREAPFYPLTGPSRLALVLNKRDTHSAYQFEAKMLNEKTRFPGYTLSKRTARLEFHTPGSQTNRDLLFDFILDQPNKALKMQVDTPWKKLGLEGSMVNEQTMKRVTLRVNLDDETEYSMRTEVQVDLKPQGKVFYPTVNIKLPQRDPIQLTGNVAFKQPSSVSLNLRLVGLFSTPVKVSGSTTFDEARAHLNTELKLECPLVDAMVEGYFEMNADNHRSRFILQYKRPRHPEENITLHYKLRNAKTGSLRKISVDTSIRNTLYPEYNNKMKWELQKTASHAETTLDFFYGHMMDNPQRRLQASVITNYQVASSRADVDAQISFSYPAKNIDFTTRLDHKHNPRMVSSKASVTYDDHQNAEILLAFNNLSNERLKMNSAFRLKYPGRDIIYKQALEERQTNEYHHSVMLQWQTGRVFTSMDVAKKVGDEYSVSSQINCPNQTPIYLRGAVSFVNSREKKATLTASYEKDSRKYAAEAGYLVVLGRILDIKSHVKVEAPGQKHDTGLMVYHNWERTNAVFTYDWVRHRVEKEIRFNIGATHRLRPDMELSGFAELVTPFRPVEKLAIKFQYTAQDQQHNANVGVTWAPQQTISLEGSGRIIDWRDFQLSGAINTPFEGYRRIASNLQCKIQNAALALALNGQKQEQRVDLELSANWKEHISGAFKFRLPNVAHNLQGGFSHVSLVQNAHTVKLNAVWDDHAYSAIIKGKLNGISDVSGSLIVNTPLPGYQKSEATYKHFFQGRKASGTIQFAFAGSNTGIKFNIENNSNYQNRDLVIMGEVMTPLSQLRIGQVTLKYSDNGARYISQVQGRYNDFTLGYDLNMNNNYRDKTSSGSLAIKTPIPGYQRVVYTWNHRFTSVVLSNNEVQINGLKYTVRINGNHNIDRTNQVVNGDLSIKTPHLVLRNAVLNIKYQNNPSKLVTSATLAVNGNTAAFSLDATGSRRDRLVCNLNLNLEPLLTTYTPYNLKPVTASLTYNGELRPNNLVSFVRFGHNQEIRLDGNFDYRGSNYITSSLVINTPFNGFNRISLQSKHEREGVSLVSEHSVSWASNQAISVKVIFQHGPTVTGEIGVTTPFDVISNFNFQYSHKREYGNQFVHTNKLLLGFMGKRITFDSGATYQGHRKVTAFAKLTSPFERYRQLSYSFRTEKTHGRRTSSFELELRPGKKSAIVLAYTLRPLDITLSIKTPCHHLSTFNAKVGHVQRFPQIRTQASFDLVSFNAPISANAVLNMQNLDDIALTITATNGFLVDMSHKKTGEVITTKLTGEIRGKRMTAEAKIKGEGYEPFAEIKITAPFIQYEVNVRTRYNRRDMVASFGYTVIHRSKTVRLDVQVTPGAHNGMVTVKYTRDSQDMDVKVSYYSRRQGRLYQAGIRAAYNGRPITFDFELQRRGQYMGKINLKTPFEGYENSQFYALLDHIPDRKLIGKLNIKTPFYLMKGLKLEYEHFGSWMNFEDKTTFEYDASISRIFYTDEWKVQGPNNIRANGRLLTPFKNAEYTAYTVSHTKQGDMYVSEMSLEYAPGRRAEVKNQLTLSEGVMHLDMTATSPADALRYFNLNVNHRGELASFTHTTSANYNREYTVAAEMEARRYFLQSGNVRITRPHAPPIRAFVTQSRTRGMFEHSFNLHLSDSKKMKLAINLNTIDKVEATIELETPFRVLPMVKVNLYHVPNPLTCTLTADVRSSRGPITLRTNLNVRSAADVKFSSHFNSPFQLAREYSLIYSHKYERSRNLAAALNVGFAPEKNIATDLKWHSTSEQSAKVEWRLTTPFEKLRSFIYTSERIQNGPTHISNTDMITHNSEPLWYRKWSVQGLNDISYEEDHPYFKNRFTSKKEGGVRTNKWSTVWPGEKRGVSWEVKYRLQNPMIRCSIQTPWTELYNSTVSLQARTRRMDEQSVEFGLTHNKLDGEFGGKVEWNVAGRSGKLTMRTPFRQYENLAVDLQCSREGNNHASEASIEYMTGKKIIAKINVSPQSTTIRVQTPFTGYENYLLIAEYAKQYNALSGTLKLEYHGDKTIEAGLNIDGYRMTTENLQFRTYLRTPYAPMESMSLDITHSYSGINFDNMIKLMYQNSKEIVSRVKFNFAESRRPVIEFSSSLQTPYARMRKSEFTYKHEGDLTKFTCSAEAKNFRGQRLSVNVRFENEQTTKGSLTVRTPFEGMDEHTFSFSHSGNARQFVTEVKLNCPRGQTGFKVDGNLQGHRRTIVTTTVVTPVPGWERMTLLINHNGSPINLNTRLTYTDSSNGRYHVALQGSKSPISGSLTVTCPYGSMALSHAGDLSGFNSGVNVEYPGNKRINVKMTFAPNSNMELKIESPWAELGITHNGHLRDFTTTAMASVNGIKVTGELRYKLSPVMTFNLQFTSPAYAAQLSLDGDSLSHRALAAASWGRHNQKIELNWSIRERIAAGMKISGTLPRLELVIVSFSHLFNGDRLSTSVNAQWTPTKRVASTLNYKREGVRSSAELIVNTPFNNYRKLSAGVFFDGNSMAFAFGASLQYRDDMNIELSANYNHKRQGDITLKTPFSKVENVKVQFLSSRIENKDGYIITVQWAPHQAITIKVAGVMTGDIRRASMDGYLEISTPIGDLRNLILEGIHHHSGSQLSTTLYAKYNHDPVFHTVFDLEFSETTLRGYTTMIRPLPIKLIMDLGVNEEMKKAEFELNWDTTNPEAKVKVIGVTSGSESRDSMNRQQTMRLTLPSRVMEVKNEYRKSMTEAKLRSSLAWDLQRNGQIVFEAERRDTSNSYRRLHAWEAAAKLTTPVRTIQATFSHSDAAGRRYTINHEFSWDLLRAPEKKIAVVSVADVGEKNCAIEIIIRPPRTHEIKLNHEAKYLTDEIIFWTRNSLSYSPRDEETLTITHDVRDDPVGRHHNYSTSLSIVHPASNIKLSALGHMGASYRSRTAGLKLGYMKASGRMSEVHMLGEVDTQEKKGKLMLLSPQHHVDLLGGLTADRYGYKIDQETIVDGQRTWWSFDLNKRNKSMRLNLHYDHAHPAKTFNVQGWYLPTEAVLQATHEDGTDTEIWGLISAKLNSSRVLHTRLHWKPTLPQQIKENSLAGMQEINNALRYEYNTVKAALVTESQRRREKLTAPDMSLTSNAITQEVQSFRNDYQTTMDIVEQMLNNNEFFLKDAKQTGQYIGEQSRVLHYKMQRVWNDYRRRVQQRLAVVRRALDQVMVNLEAKIATIVLKFRPAWQSYAYAVISSVQNTHQSMAHGWERFQEQVADTNAAVSRFFDDRFDFISYKLENFMSQWKLSSNNVFSAQERHFFAGLQEKLEMWVEKIRTRYEATYTRIHDRILILRDAVQHKLDEIMDKVMEYRSARVLVNYTKQVYYHALDAWEAWEIPKTLCQVTKTVYREIKAYVKEYLRRVIKKYMCLENSGFTVFDPENGEIRAAIFLPLEIKQFNELPQINLEKAKLALRRLKERYLPQSDYSIWDTYYKYKPSSNPLDWIPPFKAHAMLAHGKHYTTFDGVHYDFASGGTCSYVLARDFIDGNFTVVANYRSGRIHSMMIMTNGKNIEIFDDFKVTIDDHRKELPVQFDNTTVIRLGYKIRVHNDNGVTVMCDLSNKICTTNVTGWYFGKTAGLFGTYNNEQDDEFLTADRRTTTDLNQFTRTWEIGHSCPGSRNVARQTPDTNNPEIDQICENYFMEPNSVFRPCFKQVDPKPFFDMCKSDLQQDHSARSLREKACAVNAVYLAQCTLAGVHITQDSQCIKCARPGGGTYQDMITLPEQRDKQADIVLVVEEKPCNRDVINRLESIVNIIDNSLKAKGMRNGRFAVMGFGGRGVHDQVHPHTMEGQLFNEARKVRAAIRTLDFADGGRNDDVLGAIYGASQMSFRTGASKNIVLIPCSECTAQSINYAALQQILTENAINLHVMAEHEFSLRVNSPKTNYLFGMDNSAAYTMYHVNQRDLRGDVHLHRQVVLPKTLCGALALSQNGSIFNVQKLHQGRTRAQKSFVDIFARRVAKTAIPMKCQICDCVQDGDGVGKSVCRSCDMPTYNTFFKRIFPTYYPYQPTDAYRGSDKAEQIPQPIVAPRLIDHEEV